MMITITLPEGSYTTDTFAEQTVGDLADRLAAGQATITLNGTPLDRTTTFPELTDGDTLALAWIA